MLLKLESIAQLCVLERASRRRLKLRLHYRHLGELVILFSSFYYCCLFRQSCHQSKLVCCFRIILYSRVGASGLISSEESQSLTILRFHDFFRLFLSF